MQILRFHFFGSARHAAWVSALGPLVDTLNREAAGAFRIEPTLEAEAADMRAHAGLIADGDEDGGIIHPGLTPDRFPDGDAFCLPGIFASNREASFVMTRLLAEGVVRGYEPYFPIGGMGTPAQHIHSAEKIASSTDLKGLRIRVGNGADAGVIRRFGAVPVFMAPMKAPAALRAGEIDAMVSNAGAFYNYGMHEATRWHYFIGLGATPAAALWNRARIESLPDAARATIALHCGDWFAKFYDESYGRFMESMTDRLLRERPANCVVPQGDDAAKLAEIFAACADEYRAGGPERQDLHDRVLRARAQYRAQG
jgi:TRAP-type C4-dicarboxylate transport system substrate-binding protein